MLVFKDFYDKDFLDKGSNASFPSFDSQESQGRDNI